MASDRDGAGIATQIRLPGLGADEIEPPLEADKRKVYVGRLRAALAERAEAAAAIAEEGLRACPGDAELLLLAALAALMTGLPVRAQAFLKRFHKRYEPVRDTTLLSAIALQQQGKISLAWGLLEQNYLTTPWAAMSCFVGCPEMADWLREWFARTEREHKRVRKVAARPRSMPKRAPPRSSPPAPAPAAAAPLPRLPRSTPGSRCSSSSSIRRRC